MKLLTDNSNNTNTDLESVCSTVEQGSINKGKCIMKKEVNNDQMNKVAVAEARVLYGIGNNEIKGVKEMVENISKVADSVGKKKLMIKKVWNETKLIMKKKYFPSEDPKQVTSDMLKKGASKEIYYSTNKTLSRVRIALGLVESKKKKTSKNPNPYKEALRLMEKALTDKVKPTKKELDDIRKFIADNYEKLAS